MGEERAFTLIELLVVAAIIAVLSAIALPSFLNDTADKTHDSKAKMYLSVSAKNGKLLWRQQEQYPNLGPNETQGTILNYLTSREPEFTYAGYVTSSDTGYIQVIRINSNRIVHLNASRSGKIFCLENIESGPQAGQYWSSGPIESAEPCGGDAQWGTPGQGLEPTSGNHPLPDSIDIINQDEDKEPGSDGENNGSSTAPSPFTIGNFISLGRIIINANAELVGNVATNSYLHLNSNAYICGDIQIGPGENIIEQANAQIDCGGTVSHGTVELADVELPEDNDNDRLWNEDHYQGHNDPWNSSSRSLIVNSNTTVFLSGNNYLFCQVIINSNARIIIESDEATRIYLDSSENCPYNPNSPLIVNSNSAVEAEDGRQAEIAFIAAGSESMNTYITLNSNAGLNVDCQVPFAIYAPRSQITINANAHYCGSSASQLLTLNSNADVEQYAGEHQWSLP